MMHLMFMNWFPIDVVKCIQKKNYFATFGLSEKINPTVICIVVFALYTIFGIL